jgi:hypothetical protein
MTARVKRWARGLRAWLTGPKFARSVARYNRAARELDQAVREVLAR